MIKGFKLFVNKGKPSLALIEYGDENVTTEKIVEAFKLAEVNPVDTDAIDSALDEDIEATLQVSEAAPEKFTGACWVTLDEINGIAKINLFSSFGAGRIMSETDVLDELHHAGCDDYFILKDIIRRNLESHQKNRTKATFKVAERRDSSIKVEISNDKRTAYLSYIHPWGGQKLDLDDVLKALNDSNVVFGINEGRIKEILVENTDVTKQRIAGAKDSENGVDGKIEYLFDAFHKNAHPKINEDGFADFRDLDIFENVDENAPLVRKTPATPGVDGTDVTGKPIKATPGKDLQLSKGKNTIVSSEDPNLLIAARAGSPKLQHSKVIVEEVLMVDDVDFSTGNIQFNGNIVVKGVVNSGFSVEADGDITCKDTVEGADLSAGGSIFLKRGIKGLGKSRIKAGTNVLARFIERCTVDAGGSVIVDEAIIHSETSAGETVEATNSKGCIFGGHINAGSLVRASYLGSEMAVATIIEVGASPLTRQQLEELNEKTKQNKIELDNSAKNLGILKSLRDRSGLTPDREKLFQQLAVSTLQLKTDIESATERIEVLQEELQHAGEGRIEARKTIYPGVTLTIKDVRTRINESKDKATYVKDGPDIILSVDIPV